MGKFDFEDKKVKLYTQKNIIEEQLDAIDLIEHLEKLINTEFYEKMYNVISFCFFNGSKYWRCESV